MPNYDYECDQCGHTFEVFQKMTDDPLVTCPECSEASLRRKIYGGTGVIFRGSGFYVTDTRSGGSAGSSGGSDRGAEGAATGSDGGGTAGTGGTDGKGGDGKSAEAKSADAKSGDSGKSDAKKKSA